MTADSLDAAIHDVTEKFKSLGHVYNAADMVALQLGQLAEIVQHYERGEMSRAANEWADQVSIAWQALRVLHGVDDIEAFVVKRIREKVIPFAERSMVKYRLDDTAVQP